MHNSVEPMETKNVSPKYPNMKERSFQGAICLLCLLLFIQVSLHAQDELGLPKITNYTYQDYGAHQQNWWIVEDQRGIMYFANGDGVLEFDGENWRLIEIPDAFGCRSLCIDDKGTIFVGVGNSELGYLEPNSNGELAYVSLKDKIPEEHKLFADVWEVDYYKGKVRFRTSNKIYVWDGETMDVIYSENGFHVGAIVRDVYYLRIWNEGLCYLDGDTFKLVPNGELFASKRIYQLLPYGDDQVFIATREDGFYLYDGQDFTPFESPVYDEFKGEVYLPGAALGEGKFVINSFNLGLYIMDKSGNPLQRISTSTGLQDNSVTYVYEDSRGILWLSLFNGIASVDLNSNVTSFGPEFGIPGKAVYEMIRYKGVLYVGTNNGVYYFDKSSKLFKKIEGTFGQTNNLLKSHGRLLAASNGMGMIEIFGDQFRYIRKSVNYDYRSFMPRKSLVDSNRIYVCLRSGDNPGISSLYFDDSKQDWIEESRTNKVWPDFAGFEEAENGDLWITGKTLGTIDRIIPSIENNKLDFEKSTFIGYDNSNGLDSNVIYQMWSMNDKVEFYEPGTTKVYSFNEDSKRFTRTKSAFPGALDTVLNIGSRPVTDHLGRMWASIGSYKYIGKTSSEGIKEVTSAPLLEFNSIPIWGIYPEESNTMEKAITWFSGPDGLFRYEGNLEAPKIPNFQTLLRRVQVNGDSIVYGGIGDQRDALSFDQNSNTVKFQYAAPFYIEENNVEYQTKLEGFDEDWSEPTDNIEKEYINLPKGNYTFKVKAKNAYNTTAQELMVPFTIRPPWYTTWWAYLLYVLGAIGLVGWIVKQRTKGLRQQQVVLEAKVKARTQEVESRLDELATVNRVSKALTEKLEMNDLIHFVGDQMRELFKANIAYLAIHNKENNMIDFPYQYGDEMPAMQYGEGLTSQIIKTQKPLLINQDISKSYTNLGISPSGKNASSYLGVPIPVEDEVIGVLSVQSTEQESRFNDNDLRLLNTIAQNVGIAFHNAELFEEVKEAQALAEGANEAKSAFLSTVSHELRTPLTSVLGFAKIIRKRLEGKIFPAVQIEDQKIKKSMKQVSENLDVVVAEGERLTKLINDVLDLAKIESGKMEWNMKPLFMQDVINRGLASTSSLFESKGLDLHKNIQEDLPMVSGDQDKLIQVVINLLSNAVKFTDKGSVTLEAHDEDGNIVIEVQDTGLGIADDDKNKVFERFLQAGDTLTDKPQGTGLGLPICREIIEQHGGMIWMKSELGVGSSFFISIPVIGDPKSGQPIQLDSIVNSLKKQIKKSVVTSDQDAATVLIVDDDTPIRSLLRQELTHTGYQVQEAANGRIALDMVRVQKPDLIILDVMMPEINGFDVAAVLKNDPETMDIPIIILSIVEDKERGLRIGVDRYLTKPIDTEKLFTEIDQLLEQGVSNKKVMVIDQDESTVSILTNVLNQRGYQVAETNGSNLIEEARQIKPDIIMLNSINNSDMELMKNLKMERGMENILFFIYNN